MVSLPIPGANNVLMEVIDVFLTTTKPQQKVVTAQDVQSSLYYLHLDRPDDYEILDSIGDYDSLSDDEDGYGKPAILTGTGGVRRKPLPSSPMLGSDDRPALFPEVVSNRQPRTKGPTGSSQAELKPLSQENADDHLRTDLRPPLPDRKLLGPRPMNQRLFSVDHPPLHHIPEKQNIEVRRWSEQPVGTPPMVPPRPLLGSNDSVPVLPPRPLGANLKDTSSTNGGLSNFLHRKQVAPPASHDVDWELKDRLIDQETKDTSLSLIRRYNNEQWNVGRISCEGIKSTMNGISEFSHEMAINILTQGYLRFVDLINSSTRQAGMFSDKSNDSCESYMSVPIEEELPFFQRRLQTSGRTMGRNQRYIPESTESTFTDWEPRPSSELPRLSHQSSDTTDSHPSFKNCSPELMPGSKKAHILRSPWGICEFTTGVAGRSLKCKHSYMSSDPRSRGGMRSAQVSELRFNLPSSKTLGSTGSKGCVAGTPREAKRSSLFRHQRRQGSSSSFEARSTDGTGYFAPKVDFEERLDLSLGQEHAGGGFGGKQAKLGKLIIENEGLQMLDLIVAANMALWWRVYERFT